MKPIILIAGGSGLIGTRLMEYLSSDFTFHVLSRSERKNTNNVNYFRWNTGASEMDLAALDGVSIIINLAGAGIADKKWTAARRKEIISSRIDSIATLRKALEKQEKKVDLYLGASAIGYYGNTGSQIQKVDDGPGTGFLAKVTDKWEEAHKTIFNYCHRSSLLRIGIVLSKNGGALKEILKPAALGTYGYFGDGSAYYSWIHIDDICEMIATTIKDKNYKGIYNATAPTPITIKELVKAVKQAKGRPGVVLPVPTFALKLVLGDMTQMLTDSMRVTPDRMLSEGYKFLFENPVAAIKDILARKV